MDAVLHRNPGKRLPAAVFGLTQQFVAPVGCWPHGETDIEILVSYEVDELVVLLHQFPFPGVDVHPVYFVELGIAGIQQYQRLFGVLGAHLLHTGLHSFERGHVHSFPSGQINVVQVPVFVPFAVLDITDMVVGVSPSIEPDSPASVRGNRLGGGWVFCRPDPNVENAIHRGQIAEETTVGAELWRGLVGVAEKELTGDDLGYHGSGPPVRAYLVGLQLLFNPAFSLIWGPGYPGLDGQGHYRSISQRIKNNGCSTLTECS